MASCLGVIGAKYILRSDVRISDIHTDDGIQHGDAHLDHKDAPTHSDHLDHIDGSHHVDGLHHTDGTTLHADTKIYADHSDSHFDGHGDSPSGGDHRDVGHNDSPPHEDLHQDASHQDRPPGPPSHVDSHGDIPHGDHKDVPPPHSDTPQHTDVHYDDGAWHADMVTQHEDYTGPYGAHVDGHDDHTDHVDGGPHNDSHTDTHSDHTDVYIDVA